METKQLTGIVGSLILAVGVFTPVETLPLIGNNSLVNALDLAGILVLVLSTLSLILSLLDKCRFLWGTGVAALAVVVVALIVVMKRGGSFQWGWLILFTGAIVVIVAAVHEELSLRK